MDHDGIVVDGCSDLIECKIFWEDDRSRKGSIVTFLDEHTLGIEVDRSMFAFPRNGEDISRERDIDQCWIHSGDGSHDNELFCEIENIDGNLSDIDFMIPFFTNLNIDFMIIMVRLMR